MPQANDLLARRREIKQYLAEDKISQAISKLMDFVTDFSEAIKGKRDTWQIYTDETFLEYENQAIILRRQFRTLDHGHTMGNITLDDFLAKTNQIVRAILVTVDNMIRELSQVLAPVM